VSEAVQKGRGLIVILLIPLYHAPAWYLLPITKDGALASSAG